jgi:hypothetical protein
MIFWICWKTTAGSMMRIQNLKKYGIKQNIVAQMNLKNSLIHVSGR